MSKIAISSNLACPQNPEMSFFRCGPAGNAAQCIFPPDLSIGIDKANVRILDLTVLSQLDIKYSINISTIDSDSFKTSWAEMNVTNMTSTDDIDTAWSVFMDSYAKEFAVEPIYVDSCDDIDACIGVTVNTKQCVCKEIIDK